MTFLRHTMVQIDACRMPVRTHGYPLWGPAVDELQRDLKPDQQRLDRNFGNTSYGWTTALTTTLTPEQLRIWYRYCAGCARRRSVRAHEEPILRLESAPGDEAVVVLQRSSEDLHRCSFSLARLGWMAVARAQRDAPQAANGSPGCTAVPLHGWSGIAGGLAAEVNR